MDNYIFVGSQRQISNNMLPHYIKQFWRKSDHKLRVIICSVISLDFESIKNHFIHHIEGCACFYCSSSFICWVAGLLPHPLGVVPENFIFNPMLVAMVEHYLLDRSGRPSFDISLLFLGFPVCGWWSRVWLHPRRRVQVRSGIQRNKYKLCSHTCPNFSPASSDTSLWCNRLSPAIYATRYHTFGRTTTTHTQLSIVLHSHHTERSTH